MSIKTYKPTSAGQRSHTSLSFDDLSSNRNNPEKSLVVKITKTGR